MPVLPSSLIELLSLLRPAFRAPTFQIFCILCAGFIARIGDRTVCGMWQAAGMSARFHHSLAHRFFSESSWSLERLGLLIAELIVDRLLGKEAPISVAVDATVFKRSGKKVSAAYWHHDATSSSGGFCYGNCFVVLGLVVGHRRLGTRRWCLPILFSLWVPKVGPSQPQLAAKLISTLAKRFPKRQIEVVADGAFGCKAMAEMPDNVVFTTRLRSTAVLHGLTPEPTGKRGRPRRRGERLGSLSELAAEGKWREVWVEDRGSVEVLSHSCLWYSVFGQRPVRVVVVRESGDESGYRIALVSTDLTATAAKLIAAYTDRWSIEVAFQDAKQVVGVGEARNRTEKAVRRTAPFGFLCQTLSVIWYVLCGDPDTDVKRRRRLAPWYRQKIAPSMLDVQMSLRMDLARGEIMQEGTQTPSSAQIRPSALGLDMGVG